MIGKMRQQILHAEGRGIAGFSPLFFARGMSEGEAETILGGCNGGCGFQKATDASAA